MEWLTAIFTAIGKVFGYVTQRDAEKNAPDIKSAAVAAQEQSEVDATNKAIKSGNEQVLKNELSE